MTKSTITPIIGVGLMFASNGALFASLLPWYPTLMREWGLSEAQFGLIVASFAAGSIIASAVPAPIIRRFGALSTVIGGTVVMGLGVACGGLLGGGLALAGLLFFIGFVDPIVDVAQNLAAVRVQEDAGFSIMSSVHAAWSLGAALGGALGGALGTLAVGRMGMSEHLVVAAVLTNVCAFVGVKLVGGLSVEPEHQSSNASGGRWKSFWVVLPIVLVAISGAAVEELANSWSPILAVELAGVSVSNAGIALTILMSSQCIGRFAGDPMINRWGRARTAQFGGVLICLGVVLALLSHSPTPLYSGLALAGFGCATIVPSAYTAAANLPGISSGAGLTIVSWLMRLGFLFASPIIGSVAQLSSLRMALWLFVIGGVVVVLLGRKLEPERIG